MENLQINKKEVKKMKVIETKIPGVLIVETDVFGDHRGYFTETYSKPKYEKY